MFLKGLWDQHRAQKWNREQLRKSFGKAGRTEYADGELNGIVRYFEKHPKDFQIDDITWNDLNLDEIFPADEQHLQLGGTGISLCDAAQSVI